MRPVFTALVFCLLSCNSAPVEPGNKKTKDPISGKRATVTGFFDSVKQKLDLTAQQVAMHCGLDSFFFTGRYQYASFSGEELAGFRDGTIGAIVNYSDGLVCSKELIFLFAPGEPVSKSYLTLSTDCDRDPSGNFYFMRYERLSDSALVTREYFVPPGEENEADSGKLFETIRYRIRGGSFDTLFYQRMDE